MRPWRRLVENRIQEAMADGAFDNLPGSGKPLNLEADGLAGDWGMANRLLVANGMVPDWVEERRRLAAEAAGLAARYGRDHDRAALEAGVAEHNRRVLAHNVRSPLRRNPLPQVSAQSIIYQESL